MISILVAGAVVVLCANVVIFAALAAGLKKEEEHGNKT